MEIKSDNPEHGFQFPGTFELSAMGTANAGLETELAKLLTQAGVGGYANTEIGQVITLAYLQAYTDLVTQLGGVAENASAASAQQAVEMTKPGRLFANAKGSGKAVRDLDVGMMLYPTGNKEGVMWEVEDELGNKGWVSSTLVQLAR